MDRSVFKSALTLSPVLLALLLFIGAHARYLKVQQAEKSFSAFINYVNRGQYDEAQNAIQTALKLAPQNAHYLAHQALLHERMLHRSFDVSELKNPTFNEEEIRHIKLAIDCYRKVLALNPNDDCANHNLGWLYWFLRQRQQAFDSLREAVKIDSTIPIYHLSLGLLHEFCDEKQEADRQYTLVFRLSPSVLDSRFFLDLQAQAPGRAEQIVTDAISYLENRLAAGANPLLKAKLGKLYLYKESDKAENMLRQATAELPSLSRAWSNLGYLSESRGDQNQMLLCYERALFIDGFDILPWYHLGKFHDTHNHTKDAIDCYRQAVTNWMNQASIYASRVRRIYRSSFTIYDDIIPHGLLTYYGPTFDVSWTCLRLAQLYHVIGNQELEQHYEELGIRFSAQR